MIPLALAEAIESLARLPGGLQIETTMGTLVVRAGGKVIWSDPFASLDDAFEQIWHYHCERQRRRRDD